MTREEQVRKKLEEYLYEISTTENKCTIREAFEDTVQCAEEHQNTLGKTS